MEGCLGLVVGRVCLGRGGGVVETEELSMRRVAVLLISRLTGRADLFGFHFSVVWLGAKIVFERQVIIEG